MLFFFGTGSTHLGTEAMPGLSCQYCGTPDSLVTSVFSRYFHFFWIPAFPIGKVSVVTCQHCKQTLRPGERPAIYFDQVMAAEQKARVPLSNYALLLLAGAGIAFIVVVGGISSLVSPASKAAAPEKPSVTMGSDSDEEAGGTVAEPAYEKEGVRYRADLPAAGMVPPLYRVLEVTDVTPDSVFYRMTQPLHKSRFNDSIGIALSDSVPAANAKLSFSKEQWLLATDAHGKFQRLQ